MLNDRQPGPTARSTIALSLCAFAWTTLAVSYILLTATNHYLPPTQLNTLAVVLLAVITLASLDARREAKQRATDAELDGYARGYADALGKRIPQQRNHLHSVDRA